MSQRAGESPNALQRMAMPTGRKICLAKGNCFHRNTDREAVCIGNIPNNVRAAPTSPQVPSYTVNSKQKKLDEAIFITTGKADPSFVFTFKRKSI